MSNISGNAYGAAAYQQASKWWDNGGKRGDSAKTADARRAAREGKADKADQAKNTDKAGAAEQTSEVAKIGQTGSVVTNNNVKTSIWSNKGASQVPVPSYSKDYGTVIGDVSLSKEAGDYYNKLKAKYGNMEFILVSKDQKAAVQANVSKYGNAKKPVVLIDDEKLEKMATDKDFREKYEGIISMAQNQLATMKNELSSSGAAIKNFGMSVNSDGSTDYFAVMEKSNKAQAERIEKKREEKAQAKKDARKAEQKKLHDKREEKKVEQKKSEEKLKAKKSEEKLKAKRDEERRAEDKKAGNHNDVKRHDEKKIHNRDDVTRPDENRIGNRSDIKRDRVHRSYTEYSSNSLDDLVSAVRSAAYTQSMGSVQTASEKAVGQTIDFMG